MREILFRGKRLDNGEWIEGCYVKCQGNINPHTGYIAPAVSSLAFEDDNTITIGGFCEVDPATVGQYTGTEDKNGKRIFEGDIVRRDFRQEGIGVQFAVVQYIDSYNPGFVFCPLDDWTYTVWRECEVIGNIYDNQELLEAEK